MTTLRGNKVARSRRSTDNESNFGDSGYEVTMRLEDLMKEEDGTKEFYVPKKQLRKNMKLHRQMNESQREHEQKWVQHELTAEIAPVQVKDPSQHLT